MVAAAVVASVVLGLMATIVLLAAAGFDPADLANPGSLVDGGHATADLLRWGGLLDMASYLPFAVPVLYLHHRLRQRGGEAISLLTAGGLAYVLIGAIGGAILAAAGPPLIEGYAVATTAGREAARVTFETVANVSLVGLFGTLELLPFGVWIIGTGWLLRTEWPRFATLSAVAGVAFLAASARTGLTGRTLIDIDGPLAFVIAAGSGLFFAWAVVLTVRLLRGQEPGSNT